MVDDASRDTSLEQIAKAAEKNMGFARAVNDGVRHLPGEHYLVVNSDAFVRRPGSARAEMRGWLKGLSRARKVEP